MEIKRLTKQDVARVLSGELRLEKIVRAEDVGMEAYSDSMFQFRVVADETPTVHYAKFPNWMNSYFQISWGDKFYFKDFKTKWDLVPASDKPKK